MNTRWHIRRLSCRYDEGFTLPEALVAILVISMIMLTTQNFLASIAESGRKIASYNDETAKMMRFTLHLNRDLMEMVIDDVHPLYQEDGDDHCLTRIQFATRNRADPDNDFLDPVYPVVWSVREGVLSRRGVDGVMAGMSQGVYPEIKCIEFKKYQQGGWYNLEKKEQVMPAGFAWRAVLKNENIIEQVVPEHK